MNYREIQAFNKKRTVKPLPTIGESNNEQSAGNLHHMPQIKAKNALNQSIYDDFLSGLNSKSLGGHSVPVRNINRQACQSVLPPQALINARDKYLFEQLLPLGILIR